MAQVYKTEGAIFDLLRARYNSNAWALFPQVAESTGHENRRFADAIAFGLWASRGHEIHGFEIKVSRSDWLSELKKHAKSSPVQAFCHRWWIVAGDRKLVKDDELPKTWGLLVPRGQVGLEAKVKAPLLKPKRLTRKFCAAIMRRSQEAFVRQRGEAFHEMYEEASKSARDSAVRIAKREIDEEVQRLNRELDAERWKTIRLERQLKHYQAKENVAGIKLDQWPMEDVIREIGARRIQAAEQNLKSAISGITNTAQFMEEALKRLESSES